MNHFEDQHSPERHEPLGIVFEEEAKFFDPAAAQEADFLHPQQQVEESIYTDDPVRVYLHEMGAVPLLTREGVFSISVENCCVFFLDPPIESWDIDLKTFGVELVLNRRLALGRLKRFEFVESEPEQPDGVEPSLEEFLKDTSLSGDATREEIEFLRMLKFNERRPVPIYYYRELQNLRDPLHFRSSAQPRESV